MSWSSFGSHLKLSVRGAAHAPRLEFRLENFPADFRLDAAALAAFMARRSPGRDTLSSARCEPDAVEFTQGLKAGVTDGGPLCGFIVNCDVRPCDYGAERTVPRPGHADFGQWLRFGRLPAGGGMNSGRLTAALCAAGGICLQYLERRGIKVCAKVEKIHDHAVAPEAEIAQAAAAGDSVGGTVIGEVTGLPAGIGGALFDGVETPLAGALFAIPGVRGLEFGNGFAAADLNGSENNDPFAVVGGRVVTLGNNHGGILGGRTTGMPLVFRLAMKPTPTIFRRQASVDLMTLRPAELTMKGRHDPCIVRRALPVVEAVCALVLTDLLLADSAATPRICLTLTGRTLAEDLAQYEGQRHFTDLVELRADLLDAAERDRVAEFPAQVPVPVILTCRRRRDGGEFDGEESARRDFFRRQLTADFAYVDFEDDFRDAGLTAQAEKLGVRIIRSLHELKGSVVGVAERCRALRGRTREIPKLAFMPEKAADLERLFEETRDFTDIPHIVLAMGPLGRVSRILARRTHSWLTYASVDGLEALGHYSPFELVRTYRFRDAAAGAELLGITGFPLARTRSPELHNAAGFARDDEVLMVPLAAESAAAALSLMKALNLKGMAVTIPHKERILPLLDEVSPVAAAIGAVNTVVAVDGRYRGDNTDAEGFRIALLAWLGRERLDGLQVAVLGAGGAAKAVTYILRQLGATVTGFHRETPKSEFDLLVNATPVDPIPDYRFTGHELVYDLNYIPADTPLLVRARAAGCRGENGFSMLVEQARAQRRIWGLE